MGEVKRLSRPSQRKDSQAHLPGAPGKESGSTWAIRWVPLARINGAAGIPWEASKSVLKLLQRHRKIFGRGDGLGPPVGFIRWFWRVEVAAPGLGLDRQARIAAFLFLHEQNPEAVPDAKVRNLESFLIDEAWINRPEYLPADVLLFGYPRWIVEEDPEMDTISAR